MRTALLAGAFGQRNPGDEALLAAFVASLKGWRVVATSRDPDATRATHGIGAVPARPDRVARAVARADAVVMAGGTLFKTLHPSTGRHPDALLASAVATAAGARARGTDVALVGVGAAPLSRPSSRFLARRLTELADVVILRDTGSASCLRDAGLAPPFRIGSDPAWTLLGEIAPRPRRRQTLVALSHLAGIGDDLTTWVASALWQMSASGPVAVQPWQPGSGDDRMAGRLVEVLGDRVEVLPPPADLRGAAQQLAGYECVVALRFHAMVAAAAAATPVVALAHEPKLASLARRLHQPAVSPSQSPLALAEAVEQARSRGPAHPDHVRRERRGAEATLGLLRTYLDGGADPRATELPHLELEPTP